MPIRSLYQRVTSLYGRAGVVARYTLRDIPGGAGGQPLRRLDEQRRMLEVVRAMPEPYRSTLVHCHLDGHAPAALARRLGVSAEVVAARLRHALRLLGAGL